MSRKKEKREKGYGLKLIGLCCGQVSQGMEAVVIGQLTFYLTESVHLAVAAVGVLLMCAKLFDGVTDAVAGFLVDKTNSRWGKARPYSLVFIPMWIAMVLIYSVPNINVKIQMAYVFVLYIIIEGIGRTFIICIQSVLLRRAVYDEDQAKYMAIGATFAYVFGLAASVAMPLLISAYGSTREGWTLIALVYAIPGTVLGFLQFLFVKEFPVVEERKKDETVPFLVGLKALFKNKYAFLFGLVVLVMGFSSAAGSSSTYYFTYIVGDVAAMTVVTLISFVGLLSMAFLPALQSKFGSKKVIVAGLWFCVIFGLAKYLMPTNVMYQGITSIFCTAGGLPFFTFMNLISIDCMKYSYYQTGLKMEGVVASVNGVATKLGAGIGAAIVGLLMGRSGYDGQLAVQSDSALSMINFLYAGFPAICAIICIIVMQFYTLDKKLPEIDAEIARRETAQ